MYEQLLYNNLIKNSTTHQKVSNGWFSIHQINQPSVRLGHSTTIKSLARVFLLVCWLVGTAFFVVTPSTAKAAADSIRTTGIEVTQQGNDTYISWQSSEVSAASLMESLETVQYGGYDLPMQLVTVQVSHDEEIQLSADQLENATWSGTLQEAEQLTPTTDEDWNEYPELLPERTLALPSAPVFVLREGRIRDMRIAVIAFSPVYEDAGTMRVASEGQVKIAGTAPAEGSSDQILAASVNQPLGTSTIKAVPPANALASFGNAVKIRATQKGIQNVTGEMLALAGLEAPQASKLNLYFNGQAVPLEIRDSNNNGTLDGADSFRFYSGELGNYWDNHNIYWLRVESSDGLRMDAHTVSASSASDRNTAMEKGVWVESLDYASLIPGADGDHWFSVGMKAEPSQQGDPTKYSRLETNVKPNLGLASSGTSTLRMIGSAYTAAEFTLEVNMGTDVQTVEWDSRDDKLPTEKFKQNWEHEVKTNSQPTDVEIVLIPDDTAAGLVFDKIIWEQPVRLNFSSRGGFFSGVDGTWNYQLSGVPTNHTVYKITDPMAPEIIPTSASTSVSFVDDTVNDYVVAGSGTLHEPVVTKHEAIRFSSNDSANALYITPTGFESEVARLAEHRSSEAGGGYQTRVVDIQDIYDAWSYGHTDPESIRSFLRFAVASWNPSPVSVTFVGDTTLDPKNFLGKNNTNYIPPYLRDIDPWIGQTACERCYSQLHGDDPLETDEDPDFLTDIQLGRLPAKSMSDAKAMINKIIDYETATDANGKWRGISLFLADNYVERVTNGRPVTDSAGDFARFSDDIVRLQGSGITTTRIYYDPFPEVADPNGVETWRETSAEDARTDTIAAMNAGAGLVSYNGHSNHWQWATTDLGVAEPRLLNIADVSQINNKDKYFISLSMTCYTSQFQKPASAGTTLDERIIARPNGGAVATWGSSGLSVAHGHDALQRGFHATLWNTAPMKTRIGDLIDAGYQELFRTGGSCCQDARQTFLLMGDPLMTVRVAAHNPDEPEDPAAIKAIEESDPFIYLPIIHR